MRRGVIATTLVLALTGSSLVLAQAGGSRISEILNGLKEAANPVSTTGTGTFRATISHDEQEINYELTFADLEGDVRQAHIHIGHPQNSGGIVLWLCDSEQNQSPVATTPPCVPNPLVARAGRVVGTLTHLDVQNAAVNGIAGPVGATPGEFAEVVALVRAGRTYVNVHTTKFPPGEIRSQIDERDGGDDAHAGH